MPLRADPRSPSAPRSKGGGTALTPRNVARAAWAEAKRSLDMQGALGDVARATDYPPSAWRAEQIDADRHSPSLYAQLANRAAEDDQAEHRGPAKPPRKRIGPEGVQRRLRRVLRRAGCDVRQAAEDARQAAREPREGTGEDDQPEQGETD